MEKLKLKTITDEAKSVERAGLVFLIVGMVFFALSFLAIFNANGYEGIIIFSTGISVLLFCYMISSILKAQSIIIKLMLNNSDENSFDLKEDDVDVNKDLR